MTDADAPEPMVSLSFSTNSTPPGISANFQVQLTGSTGEIAVQGWATMVGTETITGTMTVTDGDGNTDTADLILNIVNHAPTFSKDVYDFTMSEEELEQADVYLHFGEGITTTDADWDQTWGGSGTDGFFTLDGQGVSYFNPNNDPVTPRLYTFTVGVTDLAGGFDVAVVNVNVIPANTPPEISVEGDALGEFSLAYNTPVGTIVQKASAHDAQDGDSPNPSLHFWVVTQGAPFTINELSGNITVTGPLTQSSYTFDVGVTDSGGLEDRETITLRVFNAVAANPQLVGNEVALYANTNASERNTGGRGYNNTFEVTVVRFVTEAQGGNPLVVYLEATWLTASADDVTGIPEYVVFGAPSDTEILRGYQLVTFNVTVVNDNNGAETSESFQIKIKEDPSYTIVGDDIRLPSENRRYASNEQTFSITEDGPVIACLPNDDSSQDDGEKFHESDIRQSLGDCYLIAAMIAAVRNDPLAIEDMINEVEGGYEVIFPGAPGESSYSVTLTGDLDRGADSINLGAADIDSQGRQEIWPLLLEMAYARYRAEREFPGQVPPGQEYEWVGNGDAAEAFEVITGQPVEIVLPDGKTVQEMIDEIDDALPEKQVMFSTKDKPADWPEDDESWAEDHVFVVDHIWSDADGRWYVQVINPMTPGDTVEWEVGDWLINNTKRVIICD